MEEHPVISFVTGGSFFMILLFYTVKNILTKIDYGKKKGHVHDIDIAVMKEQIKQLKEK